MARADSSSDVLTIRVPRDVSRKLAREAKRRGRSRSAVARELLVERLSGDPSVVPVDPAAEARRQSLLVRERESEHEALRFLNDTADLKGWR